jgi:hypothetical protein
MALIKLELPAGIYSNGTDYESSGRWNSANLVRWQNNSIRPVGGWVTRVANVVDGAPRAAHAWLDNSHDPHLAVGTYNELYAINYDGTAIDITPSGFTAGQDSAAENIAYGGKAFGTGDYGVTRPTDGVVLEATTWQLDNWGEYLIGCSVDDGKLYEWPLTGIAAQIANSPIDCVGIIATEERFIFALGAGGNPRKVAWCDRENNTDWTPAATNEAGDFELQTDGELMCGARIRGRTLLLTTTDAHIATYAGPPTVYGFERVGTSCGTATRKGLVAVGEGAFWMGVNNFFVFNGSGVTVIKCDVLDYVFNDINRQQISKSFGVHNGRFGEVWWFYPSADSTENNRYVIYDYQENIWSVGQLDRTSGIDSGVFTTPVWFDHNGNSYNHEIGNDYSGNQPYLESGPINIANGDNVMHLTQMIPDELNQGDVTAIIKTRFYPNGEEREYGPYSMSNPTSLRATGRQIRVRFTGSEHTNWRIGKMRLNVEQGGKR